MTTVALYALGVFVFFVALFASIALHELGHLYYAKKYGCRVSEYMVGFGPTVWSMTRGETTYGIKAVPLGGYVKIIGMFPPARGETVIEAARKAQLAKQEQESAVDSGHSESVEQTVRLRRSNTGTFAQLISRSRAAEFEQVNPADYDRLFYRLPWQRKVLVMLAGPAVNITIAFVCFLGVYGLHGVHTYEATGSTVIQTVAPCVIPEQEGRIACKPEDPISPATQAGLRPGDRVIAMNGQSVTSWDALTSMIHQNAGQQMHLVVERQTRQGLEVIPLDPVTTATMTRDVSPDRSGQWQEVGFLGAGPESHEVVTRHGPIYTMVRMGEMTAHSVVMIAELPVRVWNVAAATAGLTERDADSPVSIVGGSRIAGEVASTQIAGVDTSDKVAMLAMVVGSFNLFLGLFNLIPLLPLDGGQIAGATWEGLRRGAARLARRTDPGYVDVARQLPVAYVMAVAFVTMGAILIVGDLVVPLSSGL